MRSTPAGSAKERVGPQPSSYSTDPRYSTVPFGVAMPAPGNVTRSARCFPFVCPAGFVNKIIIGGPDGVEIDILIGHATRKMNVLTTDWQEGVFVAVCCVLLVYVDYLLSECAKNKLHLW